MPEDRIDEIVKLIRRIEISLIGDFDAPDRGVISRLMRLEQLQTTMDESRKWILRSVLGTGITIILSTVVQIVLQVTR